ncbi:DUF4286 domain-containing protein [bacterium]|nr:DUF4286 family protein [Chloroflexi bacterium CFX6]RIL10973.1 MAG: DUF4286 domain-containing protein [bacterium]
MIGGVVLYVVSCAFTDPAVAEAWVAWLRDGHLAEVCAAGARDAQVFRIDGDALRYDVHYRFGSRAAFERYLAEAAPRLRAEGLRRFPTALGLTYTRWVGEPVARVP